MGKRKAERPLSKPRKRKFLGNQFNIRSAAAEEIQEIPGQDFHDPSQLKLRKFSFDNSEEDEGKLAAAEADCATQTPSLHGSRIIDLDALADLISLSCVCVSCKESPLATREVCRYGMAPELEIYCNSCGQTTSKVMSKQTAVHKTTMQQVNRKAVLGMRLIGRSYKALCVLSSILDMPVPMTKNTFNNHQKALAVAAALVGKASMKKAASTVLKERQAEAQPNNVSVSTDGTWMRRGHSSVYGVQTVLSWDTHQVLDVAILSKYRPQCKTWQAALEAGTKSQEQFDAWRVEHQGQCRINTDRSAPAMESEAAVQLWNRSEELNGLRYTTYIGDGDSKGHTNVRAAKPYGDTPIIKEECVGHVQKRLGKGLRDLKQKLGSTKLSDGKPIRGKGRLTDSLIDSLQTFYGKAVRENSSNVEDTYQAIWASVCHRASSDEKPLHMYCPAGKESWCKFRRMEVSGKESEYKHHDVLPKPVFDAIKPVYVRLTDRQLLERCTRMATQNANEALNGTIWNLCPKESFCGPATVETAVFLAVSIFNHGRSAVIPKVLRAMRCDVGHHTMQSLGVLDEERLHHSARKSGETEKKARKKRRAKKKGFIDAAAEVEGVQYSAGGF